MAKAIELGLFLDNEEYARFQEYIRDPQYTPEGRKLIHEAAELASRSRL